MALPSASGQRIDGMTVNQKELAACLGISDRRIRMLKEYGLFSTKKTKQGYILEECVKEYIDYKVNAEAGRRKSITKEEVQAEHEEIKKQISIMKLRRLRRETHEASDVEAFLRDMLIKFKRRLEDIPSKLAIKIVGIEDINEIINLITGEIREALLELQEYDPEKIECDVPGDEYEDYEPEDEEEADDME